jgi:hypothetical protein
VRDVARDVRDEARDVRDGARGVRARSWSRPAEGWQGTRGRRAGDDGDGHEPHQLMTVASHSADARRAAGYPAAVDTPGSGGDGGIDGCGARQGRLKRTSPAAAKC